MLYLTGNSENIIYTNVSANKELSNPTYLMSLTHQQTGKKWTFIPQDISAQSGTPYNNRYDLFKFNISATTENLTGGTLAWYYKPPLWYTEDDDQRYTYTDQTSFGQQPIVENNFGVNILWRVFSDPNEEITGGTMTLDGITLPVVIQKLTLPQFDTKTWFVRGTVSTGDGSYSAKGLLEVNYETNSGNSHYHSYYVTSHETLWEKKPWQYYGYDTTTAFFAARIPAPITYLDTPVVNIDEIGEFRYSIYEQANPINLNTATAYNQLEVGLAYITEGFTDIFYDNTETSYVYNPDD